MIVVSGALVLVALIFLIIGLLGDGLGMIWASIGTSLVAGVFLLLGALQRRGQAPTAGDAATTSSADMMERVTAVSVKPREEAAATDVDAAPAAAASGTRGQVSIVPGRPRYHVASCRFLAGRPDVEQVDVEQARSDGFTACGVCKPDAALAAATTAPDPEAAPEVTEDSTVDDLAPTLAAPDAPATPARKAPAKRTRTAAAGSAGSAGSATTAALDVPAGDTAADEAAAPAKPARKAAAKTAAAKPAAKAAASGSGASSVVVVPDRGKFHVETCRFVKDVPGTVTLSKTTAKRQGYAPCGVCKP